MESHASLSGDTESSSIQEQHHAAAAKRLSDLRSQLAYSQSRSLGPAAENPSASRISSRDGSCTFNGSQKEGHSGAQRDRNEMGQSIKLIHQILPSGEALAPQSPTTPRSAGKAYSSQPEQPQQKHVLQQQSHSRSQSQSNNNAALHDPMIYPGVYAPSGIDMMSILIRVYQRPSPEFNIGFIDSACALTLCSTDGDMPIVYSSDAFEAMTGYSSSEIQNRNCRFLQSPTGRLEPGEKRVTDVDNNELWDMKQKIIRGRETQNCVANFRKGGEKFENLLTTIPIDWGDGRKYVVGFQANRVRNFG